MNAAARWILKYCSLAGIGCLMAACSSKPFVVENETIEPGLPKHVVYVVSHGWHTGFVLPAKEIQKELPQLHQRFGDLPYLEFGWGDRGFYQASEITLAITLRAIFWPTQAVMHVVAVPSKPDQHFRQSDIKQVCLVDNAYQSLIRFIDGSFRKDKSGEIVEDKPGIYGDSQFYLAEGSYYLMNTCNKWTAKGLKSAGLNICPLFKLSAGSVMNSIPDHENPLPDSPHFEDLNCQ